MAKVLATVAVIAINFMNINPDLFVYVEGANEARSRLYQMAINKAWNKIRGIYAMLGVINGELEPFRKNIRYKSFFIRPARAIVLQEPKEYYMSLSRKNNRLVATKLFSDFMFIDPPESEEEARKMQDVTDTMRSIKFCSEEVLEEFEQMRKEQRKWFMIYHGEPANEEEAAERADARKRLESLGLSEEWITKLRKMHGIIQD